MYLLFNEILLTEVYASFKTLLKSEGKPKHVYGDRYRLPDISGSGFFFL